MKKLLVFLCAMLLFFGMTGMANANALPNLYIWGIGFPSFGAPGEVVGSEVSLIIGNGGYADIVEPYSIGIYLSIDEIITVDDLLLIGGRGGGEPIASGELLIVDLFDGMQIPNVDITPYNYFGALIDEFNVIEEVNESDNYAALPFRATPVPEPATMLLLGSGLIGLAAFRRKFRKG